MANLKVKKLNDDAIIPSYTRDADACMDIASCENIIIPAGGYAAVRTGLAFEIPAGWEMTIRGRSGLAAKHGIGLVNGIGTIDEQYRGEVHVILCNHGGKNFEVKNGMRIAQFCLNPVNKVTINEVEELGETDRGAHGLGSSGLQ